MKITNNKELQKALKIWQKRLRLQDWKITASFVHNYQLDGRIGQGTSNLKFKESHISIVHPDEVNPNCFGTTNPEDTLVHELIHIHFIYTEPEKGIKPGSFQAFSLESAVDCLAVALVIAYNKEK